MQWMYPGYEREVQNFANWAWFIFTILLHIFQLCGKTCGDKNIYSLIYLLQDWSAFMCLFLDLDVIAFLYILNVW